MTQHHLYVSGPMTGIAEFNFPAFFEAAEKLERAGYKVSNPAASVLPCGCKGEQFCGPAPHTWSEFLRADLQLMLANCDGVAVLPGWENSGGAALEIHVARKLGWPVQPVGFWLGEAHLLQLAPGALLTTERRTPPPPPPVHVLRPAAG